MRALSIAGWSGSGKTTLITALIPAFAARGLRVSTIKHAHHDVALDKPGKDSFRHAQAGAREVILATDSGFALLHHRPAPLAALLARLAPVDLVLVEGFKAEPIPRLLVHRAALGKPELWPDANLLAVAADSAPNCPVPVLPLDAPGQIAHFLIDALGLKGERIC